MTRISVPKMTEEQLIERFVFIATEQDQAMLYDDNRRYNQLYDKMKDVEQELKQRPGDQRRVLLSLLEHENLQVKLRAALATLAVAPEASRAVLQWLSDRNRYPQAADAREMLDALDDGSYVPT
ncbi:hypothetical protein AUC70_14410 [Methyloceanibacter stevinii]|uniref:DUF2019 domain-containing protein n=1 Tax=Methyloceanibacter stevinii TaxID=1774970 RepID=A0A1E3VTX3_9HYPH|nr:DUF2019 domain-containing protein [Methyloceanibacter stevinii]ODR96955.1 hypothetical protein AUC70_14410 [Methyloceanibacter stevinii]